jgi:hypothetical protein
MEKALERGDLYLRDPEKGSLRCKKRYLDQVVGIPLQDIWDEVGRMKGGSDYPTQKPERLLERVIQISTQPGDIVCDFFCGSGTTAVVAEKLGRKWIASDLGKFAIHTSRKRIIQAQRKQKADGKDWRAFEVLNLGKYERDAYVSTLSISDSEVKKANDRKQEAFLNLVLTAYNGKRTRDFGIFHGSKNGVPLAIGPVNMPLSRLAINQYLNEALRLNVTRFEILAFEYEMGLFPAVQEEAKSRGIALVLKYIPKDVFDKRAVESDTVTFHDVAYIDFGINVYDIGFSITLKNYSVFYSESSIERESSQLKNGRSKVIVHQGKVVKVSKDKSGKSCDYEILTNKWTDWIDYWSVDFDYTSKPEVLIAKDHRGNLSEIPTGNFIFENEWQSFRTKDNGSIELESSIYRLDTERTRQVAVKVVDIFGNDTIKVQEYKVV